MTGLTEAQTSVLSTLFGMAPDSAVGNLERALSSETKGGGPMATVYGLLAREAGERRAKHAVFEPLIAFCVPGAGLSVTFPPYALTALWTALRGTSASDAAAAVICASAARPTEESLAEAAKTYDRLCLFAASALRERAPAFAQAVEILSAGRPDGPEQFAKMLDLTPLVRAAMKRLPEWVGRMTDDRAAAVRLAYKDASNLDDDAGPRFIEMLLANLSEPWLIMRVLSAVMDHPAERYVAVSELSQVSQFVLDDIDRNLERFKAFDPSLGREAGVAAGETIHIAAMEIVEFESAIELSRDGPWGKRIAQQKQSLARLAEARLAQIEKAVDALIPLEAAKFGKSSRGLPKLAADPDPAALRVVEGLLAFFDHSRQFASQSGYGAVRAKVAEKIEARLDQYVEDLLEMLRARQIEALDRVRRYLDVSARVTDMVLGPKAGQIIRRRAAAA